MKKNRFVIMSAMAAIYLIPLQSRLHADIDSVSILPVQPTDLDVISIITSGTEGSGPVQVTNAVFQADETNLRLDLFLDVGFLQMVTPWTDTQGIGNLSAGSYDLTVRTFIASELDDTYSTSFSVVPEPTSLAILTIGSFLVHFRRR